MFEYARPESKKDEKTKKSTDNKSKSSNLAPSYSASRFSSVSQMKLPPYLMRTTYGNSEKTTQLKSEESDLQEKKQELNRTGIPDSMKSRFENLSGFSFDDVRVHYNSDKPTHLQALAYTQGNQVYVAPGQERHLGHELGHVVQQKQGRVKPTIQLHGVNVNDDERLEQEADAIGYSAKEKNQAASANLLLANNDNENLIQRKIGFEFETGYTIKNVDGELSKKTPIGQLRGTNWKAEADDNGRLEFIIDPPIQINQDSESKINSIFTAIEAACNRLKEESRKNRTQEEEGEEEEQAAHDSAEVDGSVDDDDDSLSLDMGYEYNSYKLNLITGVPGDAAYDVFPNGLNISANPQVTMGLTLNQILELSKTNPEGKIAMSVGAVAGGVSLSLSKIPPGGAWGETSDKLKGLLVLISSYLRAGALSTTSIPLQYPKQITDSFILSRTNFAQLYKRLPSPELVYFNAHKDEFLNIVLAVSGFAGKGNALVLERGIGAGLAKERDIGPTRNDWILGIINGVDLMSKAENEEYESMGELGEKTELVGTSSGILFEAGGIFEIRGGQTRALDFREWRTYALEYVAALKAFQKDRSGLLEDREE